MFSRPARPACRPRAGRGWPNGRRVRRMRAEPDGTRELKVSKSMWLARAMANRKARLAGLVMLAPLLSGCLLTADPAVTSGTQVVDVPPNYREGGGKARAALPAPDW